MERASTITYLKGETIGTEPEGRGRVSASAAWRVLSSSAHPRPESPAADGRAAQRTASHRPPFQISGLRDRRERPK